MNYSFYSEIKEESCTQVKCMFPVGYGFCGYACHGEMELIKTEKTKIGKTQLIQ